MKSFLVLALSGIMLAWLTTGCENGSWLVSSDRVGWAIGHDPYSTAVILHTWNGGLDWNVEGDTSLWIGHEGNDISAVDCLNAWAALGSTDTAGGLILHTSDGGFSWQVEILPVDVPEGVKGIKGISRDEAWAVGLKGPVMRTVDGGLTWTVVPTGAITFKQVNRMDVLGNDIWIADNGNGETGIVHSADYGQTWRREQLPDVVVGKGPMTFTIVNSDIAWTNVNDDGNIYRTRDGGDTWTIDARDISGGNDIDDLCAVSGSEMWAVQNLSGDSGGHVMRIKIVGSTVEVKDWDLPYVYEGVSAFDENTAWVAGMRSVGLPADQPDGSILHTSDGETWTSQPLPVDDVRLWKISFVGARR